MMRRSHWGVGAVTCYLLVALVAGGIAAVRLSESAEMPGLAAMEIVLLALPWSLLLGQPPVAQAGVAVSAVVVGGGLLLNAGLLYGAARMLGSLWARQQEGRTA